MLRWFSSLFSKPAKLRVDLADVLRTDHRAQMSYDAARSGTDLDGHWAFSDSLDADSANSQHVRHTLMKRSRYESGSNGYYAGIVRTHCNMLVGTGPTLRMLTGNRGFNQLIEREFYAWSQRVQLRRKLWCMAYARTGDGETFAVLQTNLKYASQRVALDVMPIEAEQCQTPYLAFTETGSIDGIRYDEYGNILWYDILPSHPGSNYATQVLEPIPVPPSQVVHWFKLERAGAHRGKPDLTPTLNVGASSRRWREATVAAAESAASIGAMLTTSMPPGSDAEPDPIAPYSTIEWVKRMVMAAPMGWNATQMKSEHPNAQYADFHRTQVSEQARPLSMPYNLAATDSSTYSFASGKLDTLGYRCAIDVERQDCNDLVLDPIFAAWFREWRIGRDEAELENVLIPNHQWDWPTHPVIDAVAEESAKDTKLKNGSTTLRQVYSDQGQDLEDQLAIMAEDMFGEASEENIAKARQIVTLKNTPQHAIQYVAQVLGIQSPASPTAQPTAQEEPSDAFA
jgi:capsid protein